MFDRNQFEPIDYQDAINSPLLYPAALYCEASGSSEILKYDIEFSYMSALALSNMLPVGERKVLVGECAANFVHNCLESGKSYFAVLKVVLAHTTSSNHQSIPFLSYRSKKTTKYSNMYSSLKTTSNCYLTYCKKCSEQCNQYISKPQSKIPRICQHNEKDRDFISTLLWEDLIFAIETFGYAVKKVFEVHYWPNSTNVTLLTKCANNFIELRRKLKADGLKFQAQAIKAIALGGWGRFAMNPKYKGANNTSITNSNFQLQSKICQKKIKCFDILTSSQNQESYAIFTENNRRSDLDSVYLKREGCMALLFAHTTNSVRREVFKKTLAIIFSSNLDLVRYK